jgi:hypothetical protein
VYQGQSGVLLNRLSKTRKMRSHKDFWLIFKRTVTSKLLVDLLSKYRKNTSIKIVILPCYFTVINSCGKALGKELDQKIGSNNGNLKEKEVD